MKIEINGYVIDLSRIMMIGPYKEKYCTIYTEYTNFHVSLGEDKVSSIQNYNALVAKYLDENE